MKVMIVNIWRSTVAAGALLTLYAAQADTQVASTTASTGAHHAQPARDSVEASIERGSVAFQHYCSLCHGVTGEGNGRAARLYTPRPSNLVKTDKNAAYVDLIVRSGGAALGRSKFMPPWKDELTDEQIRDVVNYIGSIGSSYTPSK